MIELFKPGPWPDYELIDSGGFEKLERLGAYILRRPEPQAVWPKSLDEKTWRAQTQIKFIPKGTNSGDWQKSSAKIPDVWQIEYRNPAGLHLKFKLQLTQFKHVGIFPEQAVNWDYVFGACQKIPAAKVLNLFAYTGGASLAARAAGAVVTHCEAVKKVVTWGRENMELSGLTDIRWMVEDAFTWVKREAKRGNRYHGIILDPPAYGHGPQGEKWQLEEQIDGLVAGLSQILEPEANFMVFNAYSLGFSALILKNLIQAHFPPDIAARSRSAELYLEDQAGRHLPMGVVARF